MLKPLDTHEGAEAPIVGTIAAISGLINGLATDTQDFSHRLKKRPRPSDIEAPSPTSSQTADDRTSIPKSSTKPHMSPHNLNNMAWRMAVKTFDDDNLRNFHEPPKNPNRSLAILRAKIAKRKARGGRTYQIASATTHYVGDMAATGAKGESVVQSIYHQRSGRAGRKHDDAALEQRRSD
jgi:sterol 3beta-glucosyltransferase